MNRRERAKLIRRRKYANIAAHDRRFTVKNCVIPKVEKDDLIEKKVKWGTITAVKGKAEWKIPETGYPQPKRLRHSCKKKGYRSDFKVFEDKYRDSMKNLKMGVNTAWYQEKLTQHKLAKWERKNPCPIKQDGESQDLFQDEYLIPWKAKREQALERIRDLVVSMYDKLPLIGRFEKKDGDFEEKEIAKIKDKDGIGHNINKSGANKSKTIKKAQHITNQVHSKRSNLICTNLKDHMRKKGRIILPKAA